MDPELKDLYETELKHLRTHADEFASREPFRRIATRLGLNANAALRDPFVEWLLQGYAFLAARVHRRLEAEFPRFTTNLLSVVYPNLTAPTPSMVVAAFAMRPDPGLLDSGVAVPRETRLMMKVRDPGTGAARRTRRVIFTTGRAARLWPVETQRLRYLPDAAAVAAAGASRPAPAAVAVTLALTPPDAQVAAFGADTLDLFCADVDGGGAQLFEALAFATARVELAGGPALRSQPLGFDRTIPDAPADEDATDALLPYGPRSFDGWRLLHECLALPSRFHFIRLGGLRAALAGREGASFTVLFLLDRPFPALAGRLGAEALRPNCVPAVNLFRHSADDMMLSERQLEYPILPDRADPTGYEVHSVLAVRGVTETGETQRFHPYFGRDGFGAGAMNGRRHFTVTRTARVRPAIREERDEGLEAYVGSEAWLSLVDDAARPVAARLRGLSIDLLCTNRHLAVFGMLDVGGPPALTTEFDGGWREIRVVAGPSAPRSGLPEGRRLWDAVSHLSLNHLALVEADEAMGLASDGAAAALRQLMRLYAPERDVEANRLVDGLKAVAARAAVRRIPPVAGRLGDGSAPMAFARGLDLALTLDDSLPAAPTLGAVLDRVLAGQAEIGSFVACTLLYPDGRERLRLPPRSGTRPLL